MVADAGLFEGFDGGAHRVHGGGEQGGHGDDIGLFFLNGVYELGGIDIDTEVEDLEPAAFEHGGHEVFADVVQIAFDGADGHAADRFGALGDQQRPDQFEGRFHGARRDQEFGHEIIAAFEPFSHLVHGWGHEVVYQAQGIHLFLQGLFGDLARGLGVAVHDGVKEFLEVRHRNNLVMVCAQ